MVLNGSAYKYEAYQLEKVAPQIWKVQFGNGSIEYPNDPKNYLHRFRVGKFIIGHWLKQNFRYKIQYKEE
jgi:hypothetical protein